MRKSTRVQNQAAVPVAAPEDRASGPGGIGASDVVVLLAMAVAAVALGLALRLQADFGMITAAALAAAAFVVAALMHAQRMRIASLQQTAATPQTGDAGALPQLAPAPSERGFARREPTLQRLPAAPVDLDRATDHAAGQLSLAAAALRDASPATVREPADRRRDVIQKRAKLPAAEPPSDPIADADHGWAEPGTVDALVRQYAEELDRGIAAPELPRAPAPALKSAVPTPRLPSPPAESGIAAAVRRAADGEIEIHLQPVVAFSDRKARLYEVFPKIADGKGGVLSLADYQPVASSLGFALGIERAAILRCCAIQRKLSERGRARAMVIRLSAAAIRDRAFLQRLLTDMHADPLLTDLMIFEIDQVEIEQGDGVERENMDLLARAGFRFSLGSADTLSLELEELTVRRIGFVRIAAAILATEGNAAAVGDLRRGAVETILTGIANEDQARLGAEFGLVLGQGSLFSEPKPLRADVVQTAANSRVA